MTASTVSRELVVAACRGLRSGDTSSAAEAATDQAVREIVEQSGAAGSAEVRAWTAYPVPPGRGIEGLLVDVALGNASAGDVRQRSFVALTSDDDAWSVSATTTLTTSSRPDGSVIDAAPLDTDRSAGQVIVTVAVDTSSAGVLEVLAEGTLNRTDAGPPAAPVATPRTPSELQAARAAYDAALAAARKAYIKARKKARSSKRKKTAAKKAYTKRRAAARAAYAAAIADHSVITAPAAGGASRPFTLTISTDFAS